MEYTKEFKAYVLIDPITNIPRYVGITLLSIRRRLLGHLSDIRNRPDLNKHKTNWFRKLMKDDKLPIIKQIAEFDSIEEMKQFEIDYIAKYKDEYKLINQTIGGDHLGFRSHSRESILKKNNTRAVVQYNVLGEFIAEYEITEDIGRALDLRDKACSHITQCCKGTRNHAYGYIWRYKGDPLGDISNINPNSIFFNKIVQYKDGEFIAEYDSFKDVSKAIDDNSKGANIRLAIEGKQKTVKGFTFKLVPNYIYFDNNLYLKSLQYNQKNNNLAKSSGKEVQQFKDGILINTYISYSQAAETLGNYNWRSKIKECCEGKRTDWQGYTWERPRNLSNSVDEPYEVNTELNKCETTIESTSKDGSELSTLQANGSGNGRP